MTDLSFAPLLAEHEPNPCAYIGADATRYWWTCDAPYCDWASDESVVRDDDTHAYAHRAHLEAILLAEVARWLGSEGVAEVAADAMIRRAGWDPASVTGTYRKDARAALAALTTHLTGDTHD